PPSLIYRSGKLLARHRGLALVSALALCGMAGLAALFVRARWLAADRAALAQRFGQEVERIEPIMQRAYTLPLHDLRREQSLVRDELRRLQVEMAKVGEIGAGPGEYALGRGALALREVEQ